MFVMFIYKVLSNKPRAYLRADKDQNNKQTNVKSKS